MAFETLTPEALRVRYPQVGAWFAQHRSKIGGSIQSQGPNTATSVSAPTNGHSG